MDIRFQLYSTLQIALGFGGLVAAPFLFLGVGGVVFPGTVLATRPILAAGLAFGVAVVGWFLFGRLRTGRWYAIGQEAGLGPTDAGRIASRVRRLVGGAALREPLPDLAGTRQGRSVGVLTYATQQSSGGMGGGGGSNTYTIATAELRHPMEPGIILFSNTGDGTGSVDLVPGELETATLDGEFEMVGRDTGDSAERILSGEVREALRSVERPAAVFLGDPTEIMLQGLPSETGMPDFVTDTIEDRLRDHPSNDAGTVAMNNEGLLMEAPELERQVAAVTAVANAVDRVDA